MNALGAVILFLAAAASAAPTESRYSALAARATARVRVVSPRALRERLAFGATGFLLIDVRERSEWLEGRLPGAVHLSRGVLEREIEKSAPDPDAEIVLYCASGARSALAAESLGRMGYANVSSLEGGVRAWLGAGGTVVTK